MEKPTALELFQPVIEEFRWMREPVPGTAAVETIARVIAGAFRKSLGSWPFPFGTAAPKTIAYFVGAYAKPQNGGDAIVYRTEVGQVLWRQFKELHKPSPQPPHLEALERITVGVLLTKSLPHPQAAPLAASHLMVKLYLEGLSAT